jgi:hypothetical protein
LKDRHSWSNSPLKNAIFGGFFGAFVAVAQKGRVEVRHHFFWAFGGFSSGFPLKRQKVRCLSAVFFDPA